MSTTPVPSSSDDHLTDILTSPSQSSPVTASTTNHNSTSNAKPADAQAKEPGQVKHKQQHNDFIFFQTFAHIVVFSGFHSVGDKQATPARIGPRNRSHRTAGRRGRRTVAANCRRLYRKYRQFCMSARQASQGAQSRGKGCATALGAKLEHVDSWLWHGRIAAIQTGRRHRGTQTTFGAHP